MSLLKNIAVRYWTSPERMTKRCVYNFLSCAPGTVYCVLCVLLLHGIVEYNNCCVVVIVTYLIHFAVFLCRTEARCFFGKKVHQGQWRS